jgi:hypothetical protein
MCGIIASLLRIKSTVDLRHQPRAMRRRKVID